MSTHLYVLISQPKQWQPSQESEFSDKATDCMSRELEKTPHPLRITVWVLSKFFPWGMRLPTHPCLVPGLRMCGVIPPFMEYSNYAKRKCYFNHNSYVNIRDGVTLATKILCNFLQRGKAWQSYEFFMNFMPSIQLSGSDFVWR
jgi:hypothetical protein